MATEDKAGGITVAPDCRGRYTVEEVSPLNPANQPPPPSLLRRCASCLCAVCLCVGRIFSDAACGGRGRRRTIAVGGFVVLALVGINRVVMTSSIEKISGSGGASGAVSGGGGGFGLHGLARKQSYGLLRDVSRRRWHALQKEAKRQRGKHEKNAKEPTEFKSPADFYRTQWPVEFSCPHESRVGASIGDSGGWAMCNPGAIEVASAERSKKGGKKGTGGCLIYVSTRGDAAFSFEKELQDVVGRSCEIHVFRLGSKGDLPPSPSAGITVHNWGFKGNGMEVQGEYNSMQETAEVLGHAGRTVDLFVLDCPGCEWDTYKDWFDSNITFMQILVKLHQTPPIVNDFFTTMGKHGYFIFHRESDQAAVGSNSQAYSFLKLSDDFIN